jgi:3-methyl-2-oxobutanoate hydroxymethyltransferase
MKGKERVAMLTAYDVMTAHCLDKAGVEILLVGDSLGNVVYGFDSTLPVTLDMTLAHTGAVVRGSERAFVVADLPFLTYQTSLEAGIRNAGQCLAMAGAQGVKIEGASDYILELVKRLVETGIPVMGHIGLTPQSVHQMGGFYKHGKNAVSADRLRQEAKALAAHGCFAIVLECVEESVAREISADIPCLTIGIGSGRVCDGEVLVVNDVLGYTLGKAPSFAEKFANLAEVVETAARKYVDGVKRS